MKKQYYSNFILIIILTFSWAFMSAQVSIIPTFPNNQVFKFDQLLQVRILNNSNSVVNGYLEMTIENAGSQSISTIRSFPVMITQGGMLNSNNIRWQQSPKYGNSVAAEIFTETGNLPYGEYNVCYRLINSISQISIATYCLEKSSRPFGQPELMNPIHEAIIETKNPVLTWRPPLPTFDTNVKYNLVLKEKRKTQSIEEALFNNIPLLKLKNLSQTSLLYPVTATPLEVGKEYVWQVAAFFEGVEIGKTSIWVFKLKENTSIEKIMSPSMEYTTLKRKLGGGYAQIQNGKINFKLKEFYNTNSFSYKIYGANRTDLTSQTTLNTTGIHKMGYNYHTIDFPTTCSNLGLNNSIMILEITTSNGEKYYLRFRYHDVYTGPAC